MVAANPGAEARTATIAGCDGQPFTIRQAGRTAATGRYTPGDFDGDGRADLVIARRSPRFSAFPYPPDDVYVLQSGSNYDYAGALHILPAGGGYESRPGIGDFDGDGRADLASLQGKLVRRVSTDGYGAATATSYHPPAIAFGSVALTAGFDVTGKSALTLFSSAGNWEDAGAWLRTIPGAHALGPGRRPADRGRLRRRSRGRCGGVASERRPVVSPLLREQLRAGEQPIVSVGAERRLADHRRHRRRRRERPRGLAAVDRHMDILPSGSGFNPQSAVAYQWGRDGDIPVPADYDGDDRTDLGVWRPSTGTWYLRFSSTGYAYANARAIQWGNAALNDRPVTPTTVVTPSSIRTGFCEGQSYRPGDHVFCTVEVTPGANPDSTGLAALADFRFLGGTRCGRNRRVCRLRPAAAGVRFEFHHSGEHAAGSHHV